MTSARTRSCVASYMRKDDKSAGSGHSSDVGGAGQSSVKDYVQVLHSQGRQYHDILNSD